MCLSNKNMAKTTTTILAEETLNKRYANKLDVPEVWPATGEPFKDRSPIARQRSSKSISEFRPNELRKVINFPGFQMISGFPPGDHMTRKELEKLVDKEKKEPNKITKEQIKEYAAKYKDFPDDKKEAASKFREAMEHTQPAHVVAMLAILYVAFRLFPDSRRSPAEASTVTRLLYVASVSCVFGSQMWMTFVSGLALFFSVPRHVFAQVQSVLFPLYFLCNAALMLVAVVTYAQHHPTHLWDLHQSIQGAILVACFLVNLGIRLYLAPMLTKLITIKIAIETEAGLGQEVGTNRPGRLAHCPHYMKLYRAFRRTHMTIAVGNMSAMACTFFHLYYLATKLCANNSLPK
ncbi:transmembrane protein 205 [Oratosquilla oratoria]|uniref:transmembrane protein 205 n=1 Tax=Oratosquilla oratoria TaxID=337810 RepID=UPI003F75F355